MIRIFCKYFVWLFVTIVYRHKVYGKTHIHKGGGILAANHCSFLDPPILGASCPDVVHFLAKESLFSNPLFGWLIKNLKTHPVSKGKGNLNTFKKAMELIQSGKKVAIFPEGYRSADGELKEGQLGVGLMVYRTECMVIPVYIHGTFEIWNVNRRFPRMKGHTACVFGSPLYFTKEQKDGEKKEIQQEIVLTIMKKIAGLKKWYLDGHKGSPP